MEKTQDQEFKDAFQSDGAPINPTDDAAEGAGETPAVAVVIDAEAAGEPAGEAESGAAMDGEPAAGAETESAVGAEMPEQETAGAGTEGEMTPEETQRMRSWEGRLRKREEEIAAREAAIGEPSERQPDAPAEIGGDAVASVLARASELRGSADLDGLVAKFVDDFGIDTVAVLALVGSAIGGEAPAKSSESGDVAARIEALTNDIRGAFESMHFATIKNAHEDAEAIWESPEFQAWRDGLSDDKRVKVDEAMDGGNAYDVIRVLNAYKDSLKATEPEPNNVQATAQADDDMGLAEDAAGAVRGSAPLQLPTRAPASPEDEYKAAWDQT